MKMERWVSCEKLLLVNRASIRYEKSVQLVRYGNEYATHISLDQISDMSFKYQYSCNCDSRALQHFNKADYFIGQIRLFVTFHYVLSSLGCIKGFK